MSIRVPGVTRPRLVVLRPPKTARRRRFFRPLSPQAFVALSALVSWAVVWAVSFAALVFLLERHRVVFGIPVPVPTVESLAWVAWIIAGVPMGQQLYEEDGNPLAVPGAKLLFACFGILGPFIFGYRLLREVRRGRRG